MTEKENNLVINITDKQNEKSFSDVNRDDWYYDSVKYVYDKKLMQGTEKGFEPESEMTRAMLVTVLYRMSGEDVKEKSNEFYDVDEDSWYSDAVVWASCNNIASGVGDGKFAPEQYVTREQMALMFYRYAAYSLVKTEEAMSLDGFSDINHISEWAIDAIKWASATKLINGTSESTISPQGIATRAQVATILMRFCENILK